MAFPRKFSDGPEGEFSAWSRTSPRRRGVGRQKAALPRDERPAGARYAEAWLAEHPEWERRPAAGAALTGPDAAAQWSEVQIRCGSSVSRRNRACERCAVGIALSAHAFATLAMTGSSACAGRTTRCSAALVNRFVAYERGTRAGRRSRRRPDAGRTGDGGDARGVARSSSVSTRRWRWSGSPLRWSGAAPSACRSPLRPVAAVQRARRGSSGDDELGADRAWTEARRGGC